MLFFVCRTGVGHDLAHMNVNVGRVVIPTLLLVHVRGITLVNGPGRGRERASDLPCLGDLACLKGDRTRLLRRLDNHMEIGDDGTEREITKLKPGVWALGGACMYPLW